MKLSEIKLRPGSSEVTPYFYYYISLTDGPTPHNVLDESEKQVQACFSSLLPEQENYRYRPGKWTPKEILHHLIDVERVFVYRALMFAKGFEGDLHSFDHDEFVVQSQTDALSMESLITTRILQRQLTVQLFEEFSVQQLKKPTLAGGSKNTVAGLAFTIAGHDLHHLSVLKERYL